MTKASKKLLSLLLALLMVISLLCPAFAAQPEAIPIIDMRGFMSYTVYEDENDPNSTPVLSFPIKRILGMVNDLVPALTKLAFTNDWNQFGNTLFPVVDDLMNPLGFGGNGEAKNNTGVHRVYPTAEELEKSLTTEFVYDWRDDPFKSAAELNDFVNYITEELGYRKVALECHSYGGIVMLTYLSTYGTEKVHSCCFNASAVYGAQFAGELVNGRVTISATALSEFLKALFSHNDYELLLDSLADALLSAGIVGTVADFATRLFDRLNDRIWTELVLPIFGNWPSIWALVPDEDFESGYKNVFEDIYHGETEEYSGLIEKIEHFNTVIRPNRERLLGQINDSTNLYVIARYGYTGVPLGDIWLMNTDTVLNTSAEAFGAQCKDLSGMSGRFEQGAYVSPNGEIDASTCLFPDQTWFIRNCKHTQREDSLKAFTAALLRSDGQADINTFPEYPQYLLFNAATAKVTPDDLSSPVRDTFINRLAAFIRKVKDFFRGLFSFGF